MPIQMDLGSPLLFPGCAVLITLHNPREKFWGALLELSGAGIVIRGIDLNSFDDFAAMAKAGEPLSTATVFFPLLRVEKGRTRY